MANQRRPLSILVLAAAALSMALAVLSTSRPASFVAAPGGGSLPEVLGDSQDRPDAAQMAVTGPGPQTFNVASLADWWAAVSGVRPGDTIRLTATITDPLQYRGSGQGDGSAASGTAAAPITITADPGVWIDPGNVANGKVGLDILYADHINVVGVSVRNSQFGLRLIQVRGSQSVPVLVTGNTITLTGHSGLIVQGNQSNSVWSSNILLEGNTIYDTGQSGSTYGEGIYIGYGSVEWVDETNNITVRGNEIFRTTAEGIDIKTGTKSILVENNLIHDLSPIHGGAISAHYNSGAPNPAINDLDQVRIINNRIWNQNIGGVSGSNDWAIWVGHGGVEITGNRIWGFRDNASGTRAVRIRGLSDFGPHPIVIKDNLFWTAQGWVAEGSPSGAGLVQASGNIGAAAAGGTTVVDAGHFPGNVPALGQAGTADSGTGPGSAFGQAPAAQQGSVEEAVVENPQPAPDTGESAVAPTTTTQPVGQQGDEARSTEQQALEQQGPSSGGTAATQIDETLSGLVVAEPTTTSDGSDLATIPPALVDSGAASIEASQPGQSAADDAPAELAFVEGPAEPGQGTNAPAGWLVGASAAIIFVAASSVLLRRRSLRRL